MKKIFGIVGLPGAGKSTALELARNYGAVIVMGDEIREEAKRRNLRPNSITLGKIARELREKEGPDVIAKRCIPKIKETKESIVFIDGIRSPSEVLTFKEHFPLKIIAITAPDEMRFKWLQLRKRSDDSNNYRTFQQRDQREKSFGVEDVINSADFKIENDSSKEEMKKKCKLLFEKLIKE